jgi:hypothetical protein
MWVAISGEGEMSPDEMLKELQRDSICPVMTFTDKTNKQILPVFNNSETALKFAKLNTPKDYTIAYMEMTSSDIEIAKKEGLIVRRINKPFKTTTSVYVLYLEQEVVTHFVGYR